MALDATQARAGVTGNVYAAPVGTTLPVDHAALPAAWVELGYTRTGPSMKPDTSTQDIEVWQSVWPVRQLVTGRSMTSEIDLMQDNAYNLKLAFGGGTVVAGAAASGVTIYSAPIAVAVTERAMVWEIVDGGVKARWAFSRMAVSLSGDIAFAKDDVTSYPLQFTVLAAAGGGPPFTRVGNDITAFPADA